jgi:hypothetical protein
MCGVRRPAADSALWMHVHSHDLPVGRTVGKGPSGGTPYETREACEHHGLISKDMASAWQALVLAEDFADMHMHCDQRVFCVLVIVVCLLYALCFMHFSHVPSLGNCV